MAHSSHEADAIELQMRQVRTELRRDVQGLATSARELTDWTTYVRRYPWLCLGAAAALGYLLVPQRAKVVRPDPQDLQDLVKHEKLVVTMPPPARPGKDFTSMLVGMATSALVNGGMAILSKQIDQFVSGLSQPPRADRREDLP
jgi:hypothetical protein